jgi:flagellar biosynthesis/type III secretory pathway protein FliH
VPALTRVVKAGDVVAVRREEQAAALAQLELDRVHRQAAAASFSDGYQAGRAAALAEGTGADLRAAAALDALAAAAVRAHAEEVSGTSRAVLAAALDVAEWVLRHELPADSRSLLTRLGEAAGSLLPSPSARVSVSPHDEAAVRPWAARRRGVEVVVDPSLAPGDAAFDTDAGSVEVSVAAALRIAAETLGVDPARGVQ